MLENGLEALLIRDDKADKASGALDVKVGHLADPEDLQGLAHFCEHLLFMGTEKVSIPLSSPLATRPACYWAARWRWQVAVAGWKAVGGSRGYR